MKHSWKKQRFQKNRKLRKPQAVIPPITFRIHPSPVVSSVMYLNISTWKKWRLTCYKLLHAKKIDLIIKLALNLVIMITRRSSLMNKGDQFGISHGHQSKLPPFRKMFRKINITYKVIAYQPLPKWCQCYTLSVETDLKENIVKWMNNCNEYDGKYNVKSNTLCAGTPIRVNNRL